MTMNKTYISIAVVVVVVVVALYLVLQRGTDSDAQDASVETSAPVEQTDAGATVSGMEDASAETPTERFSGIINGESIMFQHADYVQYMLVRGNESRTGELNTERGFGDDMNATVYVLYSDDGLELEKFVRLTNNPGTLYRLNDEQYKNNEVDESAVLREE